VSPDALLFGFVAGVTVTGLAVGLVAWLAFCCDRQATSIPCADPLVNWKKENGK
jgi:hypothetical protein